MRRRLLNLVTVLSLLLCAAVAALGVRSFVVTDCIGRWNGTGFVAMAAFHRGSSYLAHTHGGAGQVNTDWKIVKSGTPGFAPTAANLRGMGTEHWSLPGVEFSRDMIKSPGLSGGGYTLIRVHLWLPAALLLAMGCAAAFAARRGKKCAGLCPKCGYDLRATPDRCPECGTTPVAATAQQSHIQPLSQDSEAAPFRLISAATAGEADAGPLRQAQGGLRRARWLTVRRDRAGARGVR